MLSVNANNMRVTQNN